MDTIERAAFLQAQAACAMTEALGMQAANQIAIARGDDPPFKKEAFDALQFQYGIDHNSALIYLRQ